MAKRRKPKKKNRFILRWIGRLMMWVGLPALVAFGFYCAHLNKQVVAKFEGKRWELPARVYSRSQDIYTGAAISSQDFLQLLDLLNYRDVSNPKKAGQYSVNGNTVNVKTLGFKFSDENVRSTYLSIQFSADKILSIKDADSNPVAIHRMEPHLIANIYPSHNEDRVLVKKDDVPSFLIDTLIAVEDQNFYSHHGVRPKSILRAMIANIQAGRTVQGGSTLTQQLIKNFYLTNERKLKRKINEAIMAMLLEWHYDKDEILEAYLNEVNLGQDGRRAIHGFGLASQFYFKTPLQSLNESQMALLVGMVKGPSYYNPRRNPENATIRRNVVFDVLAKAGLIEASSLDSYQAQDLGVVAKTPSGITNYPAFMQLVRAQLQRDYREEDLRTEGLQIFTTFDPIIQLKAESSALKQLAAIEKKHGLPDFSLETAIVISSVDRGEVQAIVGGREPGYAGFNRALDAKRPIGSLVKPAIYLSALEQSERYSLATLLDDSAYTLELVSGDWSPENYDGEYHGQVKLLDSLIRSYNVSTVRLGMDLGLDKVITKLKTLGIERPINKNPSLLLGSVEVPAIEVTQMYQTLAAGGYRSPLRSITSVVHPLGNDLQRYPLEVEQVIEDDKAYLMTYAMHEVTQTGTARYLANTLPADLAVAGKTGTSNGLRDSWFAGYSGEHVMVVWVGRDDNKSTSLTGSSGALRVWQNIMSSMSTNGIELDQPDLIEWAQVDQVTGMLVNGVCTDVQWLPFIKGSKPSIEMNCEGSLESDAAPDKGLDWFKNIFR